MVHYTVQKGELWNSHLQINKGHRALFCVPTVEKEFALPANS